VISEVVAKDTVSSLIAEVREQLVHLPVAAAWMQHRH
jgi:hypothetical protein